MEYAGFFIAGLVFGALIVFIVNQLGKKNLENSFKALSRDALKTNSDEFLKIANEKLATQTQVGIGELEGKKKLIEQTLQEIRGELTKVETSVKDFDNKRELAFGTITTQLRNTAEQTTKLQGTTDKLQLALANTRARGQWGERIAEDILQLVGFVENVDYTKQKTQETTGKRPDFTFFLPQNLKVNMDSKFPFDNYTNYINAESNSDKDNYKQKFKSDVRNKIKEVITRDYINSEDNTVDYAIMFIPNEQVFRFLYENDANVFDDALKDKVILCSPITLFAILCVIREAVKVFKLQKTTGDILQLLGAFNKQWTEFKKSMDKMGEQIEKAHEEFGKLKTTRSNKLEIPLKKVDALSKQKGFLESPLVDEELESKGSNEELELESPDEEPELEGPDKEP